MKYDLSDMSVISALDDLSLWSAPFGLKLLDQVKYRNSITVLDIGSGNGFPIIEIASCLGETCSVFGIDPWVEANKRAREKIITRGLNNIKIIDAVAESIPFDDAYFDLLTSNNGINNVRDDRKLFPKFPVFLKPADNLFLL